MDQIFILIAVCLVVGATVALVADLLRGSGSTSRKIGRYLMRVIDALFGAG